MIADGRVRPIIGARLPIEQAAAAHELSIRAMVSGKVLLTVASSRTTSQPSDASARTSWSTSAVVE